MTKTLVCLSCYAVFDGEIQKDDLGYFAVCPECDASFPVDMPEEGGVKE